MSNKHYVKDAIVVYMNDHVEGTQTTDDTIINDPYYPGYKRRNYDIKPEYFAIPSSNIIDAIEVPYGEGNDGGNLIYHFSCEQPIQRLRNKGEIAIIGWCNFAENIILYGKSLHIDGVDYPYLSEIIMPDKKEKHCGENGDYCTRSEFPTRLLTPVYEVFNENNNNIERIRKYIYPMDFPFATNIIFSASLLACDAGNRFHNHTALPLKGEECMDINYVGENFNLLNVCGAYINEDDCPTKKIANLFKGKKYFDPRALGVYYRNGFTEFQIEDTMNKADLEVVLEDMIKEGEKYYGPESACFIPGNLELRKGMSKEEKEEVAKMLDKTTTPQTNIPNNFTTATNYLNTTNYTEINNGTPGIT